MFDGVKTEKLEKDAGAELTEKDKDREQSRKSHEKGAVVASFKNLG